MCFLDQEYLDLCDREFQKTVELGADGILFDECLHHGPALLCFDPHHGHRYGAPVYANDRKLIQNFSRISDPVRPDFLFSGEACYDWEMEAYQLSYHRSENKQHIPLSRYMLPQAQFMTAVTGFNDRNMINQCLMYRYMISYEPYNFKGRLDDYPLTDGLRQADGCAAQRAARIFLGRRVPRYGRGRGDLCRQAAPSLRGFSQPGRAVRAGDL